MLRAAYQPTRDGGTAERSATMTEVHAETVYWEAAVLTDINPSDDRGDTGYGGSFELAGLGLTRHYMEGTALPPDLTPQIVELLRVAFNGGPGWFALPVAPADHLDWKFRDFPGGTDAKVTFDQDGQVVGFTAGFHRRWLVKGQPYVARDGVDLCRHPDWQGRGVMRALKPYNDRERHPDVQFGLSWVTYPDDRRLSLERGNRAPANETRDYLRPFGLPRRGGRARSNDGPSRTAQLLRDSELSRWSRLRRSAGLAASYGLSVAARRRYRAPVRLTVETVSRFDQSVEDLARRASAEFDLIQERSLAYLNWRYADERAGPFTIRVARRAESLLGFAVTRVLEDQAHLVDVLALPDAHEVAETLIRDSMQIAQQRGARSLRCRLPRRHPYSRALRRAGFVDLGALGGELIDPDVLDADVFEFLGNEEARIHLTYGDSDAV